MEPPRPEYSVGNGPGTRQPSQGFNPGQSGQHTYIGMTDTQPPASGHIVIAYPTNEAQPKTHCTLILSTLSTIFCFMWCGLMAMGVTWQARLQVLDGKFAHARHSLTVANILNVIALVIGLVFWVVSIFYIILIVNRY